MLPRTVSDDELRQLFEPFGPLEEASVLRGLDGVSKGGPGRAPQPAGATLADLAGRRLFGNVADVDARAADAGCAFVRYQSRQSAQSAIDMLDQKTPFPVSAPPETLCVPRPNAHGADGRPCAGPQVRVDPAPTLQGTTAPIVVRFADTDKQRQQRRIQQQMQQQQQQQQQQSYGGLLAGQLQAMYSGQVRGRPGPQRNTIRPAGN